MGAALESIRLTDRENEVMSCMAKGLLYKEIELDNIVAARVNS
jgi:DNA-binding NarL/FixJ family response regulator